MSDADAVRGIAWWNAMTHQQRAAALKAADTAIPAVAWAYFGCIDPRAAAQGER